MSLFGDHLWWDGKRALLFIDVGEIAVYFVTIVTEANSYESSWLSLTTLLKLQSMSSIHVGDN